jgi:hypothetical protein
MFDSFDILKKLPDGGIVWVEAAKDLESAKARIQLFSRYKPGQYVVFDQMTQAVLEMWQLAFVPDAVAAEDFHLYAKKTKKKETKKKPGSKTSRGTSPSTPKVSQVIASIVDDIHRNERRKH